MYQQSSPLPPAATTRPPGLSKKQVEWCMQRYPAFRDLVVKMREPMDRHRRAALKLKT